MASDKTDIEETNAVIDGFEFDPSFADVVKSIEEYSDQCAGVAEFRATRGDAEIRIRLFNYHNGYYGHGFEFSHGETEIRSGCL